MENYIVYQITNKVNNNIYVGVHITKNINDSYMGSGREMRKALEDFGKENFDKIILYNFDNEIDMLKKEREIVDEHFIKRDDTYNLVLGGGGITTLGLVVVKDKLNNKFTVSVDDPRFLSGELKPIRSGMVMVKDENGNRFTCSVKEPKFLNGEYVSVNKGKISVKDKDNNIFWVDIDDPRYLSGELVYIWKGKKHTDESKRKIGQKNSILQKGKKNSQYGTCWIYNEKIKESKKIKKNELNIWLNKGWKKGRKMMFN